MFYPNREKSRNGKIKWETHTTRSFAVSFMFISKKLMAIEFLRLELDSFPIVRVMLIAKGSGASTPSPSIVCRRGAGRERSRDWGACRDGS